MYECMFMLVVCRCLGTPNEDIWPGVTSLQDWNPAFPIWPAVQINKLVPDLDDEGQDLLEVSILSRI